MSDEEKKEKYRQMVYRLRIINNGIYGLNDSISTMQKTMSKSLSINDKEYGQSDINDIKKGLNSVSYTINNYIIISLTRKINS